MAERATPEEADEGDSIDSTLRGLMASSEASMKDAPLPPELECGEVVGGRFRVGLAGRGGMGSVYRAIDLLYSLLFATALAGCENLPAESHETDAAGVPPDGCMLKMTLNGALEREIDFEASCSGGRPGGDDVGEVELDFGDKTETREPKLSDGKHA